MWLQVDAQRLSDLRPYLIMTQERAASRDFNIPVPRGASNADRRLKCKGSTINEANQDTFTRHTIDLSPFGRISIVLIVVNLCTHHLRLSHAFMYKLGNRL